MKINIIIIFLILILVTIQMINHYIAIAKNLKILKSRLIETSQKYYLNLKKVIMYQIVKNFKP